MSYKEKGEGALQHAERVRVAGRGEAPQTGSKKETGKGAKHGAEGNGTKDT